MRLVVAIFSLLLLVSCDGNKIANSIRDGGFKGGTRIGNSLVLCYESEESSWQTRLIGGTATAYGERSVDGNCFTGDRPIEVTWNNPGPQYDLAEYEFRMSDYRVSKDLDLEIQIQSAFVGPIENDGYECRTFEPQTRPDETIIYAYYYCANVIDRFSRNIRAGVIAYDFTLLINGRYEINDTDMSQFPRTATYSPTLDMLHNFFLSHLLPLPNADPTPEEDFEDNIDQEDGDVLGGSGHESNGGDGTIDGSETPVGGGATIPGIGVWL